MVSHLIFMSLFGFPLSSSVLVCSKGYLSRKDPYWLECECVQRSLCAGTQHWFHCCKQGVLDLKFMVCVVYRGSIGKENQVRAKRARRF